jgi:hypothetical protein
MPDSKRKKHFFFEKKKQKTFTHCVRQIVKRANTARAPMDKIFWVSFQKRTADFCASRREQGCERVPTPAAPAFLALATLLQGLQQETCLVDSHFGGADAKAKAREKAPRSSLVAGSAFLVVSEQNAPTGFNPACRSLRNRCLGHRLTYRNDRTATPGR